MFEGFDFSNFWEDSEYALKEYVSEPPTDKMIDSVERDTLSSYPITIEDSSMDMSVMMETMMGNSRRI